MNRPTPATYNAAAAELAAAGLLTTRQLIRSGLLSRQEARVLRLADRYEATQARQALARFRAEWQATRKPVTA